MRAALHVVLTPIVFLFAANFLLSAGATLFGTDLGTPETPLALTVSALFLSAAALVGGVAYGWRNRHR